MAANVILTVDLGFGDAGKGSIIDWLARSERAKLVVRYNGGCQAAHNVVTSDGRHHTFAQFGSGSFVPGVHTYLSRFMLVAPDNFLQEETALVRAGIPWDYKLNGGEAMGLIIFAAAWKQVSYNFLFFLAGLQAIPRAVLEAASIDGAGGARRFWTIVFPLLSPTTFFLLVVNIVYAFFDTFGIIDALTQGGPGKATETLIYKVYVDGIVNLDLGGSAAQSAILMAAVIVLTALQFRYIERRVQY